MLTLKNRIALIAGKLALKILSERSSSAPGLLASKISKDLLDVLLASIEQAPIFITGTNGKSTTAGILASILKGAGKSIVHNRSGANLQSGLLTALLKQTTMNGTVAAKMALLEVDEAVLRKVSVNNEAQLILVNNFFRDQLDRFGEMEQSIAMVCEGLNLRQEGALVVSGDDPNVCRLAVKAIHEGLNENQVLRFGILPSALQLSSIPEIFAEELASCPSCGQDLQYSSQWLGQFGDFYCPHCAYRKPNPDVLVTFLRLQPDFSEIEITFPEGHTLTLTVPLPGLFNVYNALAAVSAAYSLKISLEDIATGVENYKSLFGRSQEVCYKDKRLKFFLIKNPIGASEVLRLISSDPKAKILIAINDDYADGRDVSWLWDAHFEYLNSSTFPVYTSGSRGLDMAVRLKYAGVKDIKHIRGLQEAIDELSKMDDDSHLYVLPTYTALLKLVKLLNLSKE